MPALRSGLVKALAVILASATLTSVLAQSPLAFLASLDHPAIAYSTAPVTDPVSKLNRAMSDGTVRLTAAGESRYLSSVLQALSIPVESQVAVYSASSFE